jgi:hypothetical protein
MIEMLKTAYTQMFSVSLPSHLLPLCYPEPTYLGVIILLQRDFSIEFLALVMTWVVHPECVEFRRLILETVIQNSAQLLSYVYGKLPKELPLLLLLATRCVIRISTTVSFESVRDVWQLMRAATFLITTHMDFLKKGGTPPHIFLSCLTDVLFDRRHAHLLARDLDFLNFFRTNIGQFMLLVPSIFFHPLVIREAGQFSESPATPGCDSTLATGHFCYCRR